MQSITSDVITRVWLELAPPIVNLSSRGGGDTVLPEPPFSFLQPPLGPTKLLAAILFLSLAGENIKHQRGPKISKQTVWRQPYQVKSNTIRQKVCVNMLTSL